MILKKNLNHFTKILPNFDEADNSYTTGFASVFNNYKAMSYKRCKS